MSETREEAATRRRWVTLAEFVAVAGLLIGALTLWLNWSERRDERADKAAISAGEARERARVDLSATVADDGGALRLADPRHELQDVTIAFPPALTIATQRPAEPVVEASAFEDALLAATDGGADERSGRLPVLIGAAYWDGDAKRTATSTYDVIWRTEGRVLRGRALRLTGLRLRARGGDAAGLDAAWKRELAR